MKKTKGSWIVNVEYTVTKELICEDCTEAEARENPFTYSVQERELGTSDWDVKHVAPNK